MPVRIVSRHASEGGQTPWESHEHKGPGEPIRIGLVNNMPEGAFKATEHQFLDLLKAGGKEIDVELSLFVLRGTPMAAAHSGRANSRYACTNELAGQRLDGLIVTGTEPLTPSLKDEPYWPSFTQLVEWARENTVSTVWSCLAAHAAVLQMDGIERRRSEAKHFGIFACDRVSDHWLLKGAGDRVSIPHSRWNGVGEGDLVARGYEVVTRTADGEVDTFVKQENGVFVFFQGHPEYETDTLLREYRRDVGRYLSNEANAYPLVPHGYFDRATEASFATLRENAASFNRDQILEGMAAIMKSIRIENTWKSTATLMYGNWLAYLSACKEESRAAGELDSSRVAYP